MITIELLIFDLDLLRKLRKKGGGLKYFEKP